MFIENQFSTLFDYHWHTTKQLISSAESLGQADYHDGIHEILFHILRADHGWRVALSTGAQQTPLSSEAYPDLQTLQSGFESEKIAWQKYLGALSDDDIQAEINLKRANGEEMTFLIWRILQHVVMHGMQHHAEIAQFLTEKGQSPGNIDFLFFR
jgi:uncharacterized damage-inducible protein DinB